MSSAVILLMLVAGALVAIQAPLNAMLARGLGSPVSAATVSFAVGLAALALIALATAPRPDAAALRALPPHAWIGGLMGAVFVASAAWAAPRLGVAWLLVLTIAGQLAAALVIDHFGLFGAPRQPASAARLAGLALVLAGAALMRRA
jgi:transporter family-2 protein